MSQPHAINLCHQSQPTIGQSQLSSCACYEVALAVPDALAQAEAERQEIIRKLGPTRRSSTFGAQQAQGATTASARISDEERAEIIRKLGPSKRSKARQPSRGECLVQGVKHEATAGLVEAMFDRLVDCW